MYVCVWRTSAKETQKIPKSLTNFTIHKESESIRKSLQEKKERVSGEGQRHLGAVPIGWEVPQMHLWPPQPCLLPMDSHSPSQSRSPQDR